MLDNFDDNECYQQLLDSLGCTFRLNSCYYLKIQSVETRDHFK
jgi:hypothetical protein